MRQRIHFKKNMTPQDKTKKNKNKIKIDATLYFTACNANTK